MDEFSSLDDAVRDSIASRPCSILGCKNNAFGLSVILTMKDMEEVMSWLRYTTMNMTFVWKPQVVDIVYEVDYVKTYVPMCRKHFEEWADDDDLVDYSIKPHVVLVHGIDY